MFTKLLAYEIRSRAVADGRSFGAFIVTIAVASGIVAAGLPGISGSTAVLAYALCALTPVACAIAALADYWKTLYGQRGYFTMNLPISGKGHLLGEEYAHHDGVPPGPRPGRRRNPCRRVGRSVERRH